MALSAFTVVHSFLNRASSTARVLQATRYLFPGATPVIQGHVLDCRDTPRGVYPHTSALLVDPLYAAQQRRRGHNTAGQTVLGEVRRVSELIQPGNPITYLSTGGVIQGGRSLPVRCAYRESARSQCISDRHSGGRCPPSLAFTDLIGATVATDLAALPAQAGHSSFPRHNTPPRPRSSCSPPQRNVSCTPREFSCQTAPPQIRLPIVSRSCTLRHSTSRGPLLSLSLSESRGETTQLLTSRISGPASASRPAIRAFLSLHSFSCRFSLPAASQTDRPAERKPGPPCSKRKPGPFGLC